LRYDQNTGQSLGVFKAHPTNACFVW
jgi:hypothetical protein